MVRKRYHIDFQGLDQEEVNGGRVNLKDEWHRKNNIKHKEGALKNKRQTMKMNQMEILDTKNIVMEISIAQGMCGTDR